MSSWNAMTYEGKDTILRVVRNEAEQFFAMVDSDDAWEAPTGHWQVRDIVGHIIDTTEAYFVAFDAARGGTEMPAAYGLPEDGGARRPDGHRAAQRAAVGAGGAAAGRLRQDDGDLRRAHRGRLVEPHGVALLHGPLPAFFYPAFQLMDYGVHSWDVRQGTGRAHGLAGEVGDLLVPFMFVLWKYTVASSEPDELGIRVTSGPSAGDTRVTVGPGGMDYQPGDASDLTVIEFDPGSFVLTAFGRSNAGSIRGDRAVADQYLNLFFRI